MRLIALLVPLLLNPSPGQLPRMTGRPPATPGDTGEVSRRTDGRPECPMPVLRPRHAEFRMPQSSTSLDSIHSDTEFAMPIARSGCWNPLDTPNTVRPAMSDTLRGRREPQ